MVKYALAVGSALVAAYAVVLAGFSSWAGAPPPHAPCRVSGAALQVDSSVRVLSLCRNGVEEASFRVALGRGGLDKRSEGDGRTPRGQYRLESARAEHDHAY